MKKPMIIDIKSDKKIFFCSDHHFGAPNYYDSQIREVVFIKFLNFLQNQAESIFFLGDLFHFWHEYKYVIPKGHVRLLGKLAELSDKGIKLYYFIGNHDLWIRNYFEKELGFIILKEQTEFIINNKFFLIGHGDIVNNSDFGYTLIKKIFMNSFSKFVFRWLHPDLGIPLGNYLSKKKKIFFKNNEKYLDKKTDYLLNYIKLQLRTKHYDYFIFGHRHLPLQINLLKSVYFNLGDWIQHFTYLEYYNYNFKLKKWTF